jgi:serine/threonine protein kinase
MNYLYGPRIPYVKSFGQLGYYNILIMELLGKSLYDIKNSLPNLTMSIPCVCKLSIQMIQILQHIHSKNFVHRDVKPDNFIMGLGPNNKFVYIIDLGFAKAYKDPRTLAHIPISQKKGMTGTARYASINALKGFSQSRRDDLESLGYTIIELAKGCLPWSTITGNTKDELYDKILQSKINTSIDILCSGLPNQFKQYVEYVRKMEYEQEPDYNYLKNLFLSILRERGQTMNYEYDWDNAINDLVLFDVNNNINNNTNVIPPTLNFTPNLEKYFNDDNILKANYKKEYQIAIQNNIFTREEINDDNIEPFPIDTFELKRIMELQKNKNKKRFSEPGCQCCLIM